MRSVETQHRYTLSAAIRRAVPAGPHDSTGSDDRDPAIAAEARDRRRAAGEYGFRAGGGSDRSLFRASGHRRSSPMGRHRYHADLRR